MSVAAAAPVAIGQVVGTYRIVSLLGAGGMGAVWLAEHTLLGRRVAIKFLHPEVSRDPANVERFFAEARAATRIADPGIVVVYDFGWHTDASAYIVMEHLGGDSVATRLRAGRLAVVDAVRVVQQAAMAMAVAHRSGIIHRDLKPDNLFLVPDPAVPGGERIKILDFGIAKLVGDEHGSLTHTRTGAIIGTPTYMSPEQCRGGGDIDHRTDIYAIGCVLFHLLCGQVPFDASTPGEMIAAHLREAPPPPSAIVPEVPPALDAIVLRCLAKAASERYATMTDLAHALAHAMEPGATVTPTPPRRAAREAPARPSYRGMMSTLAAGAGESLVPPPPRGRSLVIVLAAAAVLAMVATVAIMLATATPPSPPAAPSGIRTDLPVDAGVGAGAPTDADASAAPAVVAPASLDAGVPAKAAPKPKRHPRAKAAAHRCDVDPYACP